MLRVDRLAAGGAVGERVQPLAGLLVVREAVVEVGAVALGGEPRQEGAERRLHVADEGEVEPRAAAEVLGPDVDLRDLRLGGVELAVGKVGAQHQERVALQHRVVAGREADQPGHPDVVRVVVLDVLLAAQRVDDGGLQRLGEGEHLGVRAGAAAAAEERGAAAAGQHLGERVDPVRRRSDDGLCDVEPRAGGDRGGVLLERDVAGDHHDGDATLAQRRADGGFEHAGELLGVGDELAVVAAFAEELVGVGFLKVAAADFGGRDLRGDGEHRHA